MIIVDFGVVGSLVNDLMNIGFGIVCSEGWVLDDDCGFGLIVWLDLVDDCFFDFVGVFIFFVG